MTLIRKIKGLSTSTGMKTIPVIVYFTSDNHGETLSLMADGHQITVNYADILKIVERERAKGYTDGHFVIDEGWGDDA